ncbi:MAG: hypothetical protein IKH75_12070 [Ruminococcus sp.]|nr:hypothetical protein [Ruminococcus sp.]
MNIITASKKKKELKSLPLYNSLLKLDTEFKTYRDKCNINKGKRSETPSDYTYLSWKNSIKSSLEKQTLKYNCETYENYMHYLIHLKRIEESLISVPTAIFGFLFGGACIKIFEKPIIGFKHSDSKNYEYEVISGKAPFDNLFMVLLFVIALIAFVYFDMYVIYRQRLWIWYYEDIISIVQEIIENYDIIKKEQQDKTYKEKNTN